MTGTNITNEGEHMSRITKEELKQRGYNMILWMSVDRREMTEEEIGKLCSYMDERTGIAGVYISPETDIRDTDFICTDHSEAILTVKSRFPEIPVLYYSKEQDKPDWKEILT